MVRIPRIEWYVSLTNSVCHGPALVFQVSGHLSLTAKSFELLPSTQELNSRTEQRRPLLMTQRVSKDNDATGNSLKVIDGSSTSSVDHSRRQGRGWVAYNKQASV